MKINLIMENWRKYLSEDQLLKEQEITQYIVESNIEHLWENNSYELLNEDTKKWLHGVAHVLLDVLGAAGDFVSPGAGAIFDLINMVWYLKKGCWLYAAFSAIAVIPYIGDVIGKGGKAVTYLKRGAAALKMLKGKIADHEDDIKAIFDIMATNENVPEIVRDNANEMESALFLFSDGQSDELPSC